MTLIAPVLSRQAPSSRTASVPTLGRLSITGSNRPRSRPTATRASRSSDTNTPNRRDSSASRPIVLTTSAPSKLSCATALTLARIPWARICRGDIRREYSRLSPNSDGNSATPTSASTQSVANRTTSAMKIITTVPTANGSGAIGTKAASTSELALDSSVPVACRWCQAGGSAR